MLVRFRLLVINKLIVVNICGEFSLVACRPFVDVSCCVLSAVVHV